MNKTLENFKNFFTNVKNIAIIIAIIFVLLYFKQCSDSKDRFNDYDRAIAALNDSIHKVVSGKDTIYIERVVSFDLKDILNSEAYKSLSKEKQKFLRDLLKIKGLLTSAEVTIESKDSIIDALAYQLNQQQTDSTICFKKNKDTILFNRTTGNLQYKERIWFNDSIRRNFDYTYKIKIQSTYTKEKDGSIIIRHKLDDPRAEVIEGIAYTIPSVDDIPRTKIGKWLKDNKTTIYLIGGVTVGLVSGVAISKL